MALFIHTSEFFESCEYPQYHTITKVANTGKNRKVNSIFP